MTSFYLSFFFVIVELSVKLNLILVYASLKKKKICSSLGFLWICSSNLSRSGQCLSIDGGKTAHATSTGATELTPPCVSVSRSLSNDLAKYVFSCLNLAF